MVRINDLTPNLSDGGARQEATFSALFIRLSKFAIRKRYACSLCVRLGGGFGWEIKRKGDRHGSQPFVKHTHFLWSLEKIGLG